ncbi:Hypothetical protein PHPALM_18349 [Phytophthora palmivora]|uniref:DDE-1 domain-containing protein n=1 Tax=Phytophthora palmivora TaxID=4796 RepID=A0A2P4XJZ8_9STRA|nr:Hypothetical protein PHPALM_18349 [Phytophthora palmivora]
MQEWIDNVWAPDIQGPSVLVLDSLKTHKMECIRTRLIAHAHTSVVYIPPGITGLSQPMDVSIGIYMKYVLQNGILTDAAQKRRHIAMSVLQALEEVKEVTIRNGYLKGGLVATGPRDMESNRHATS